MAVHGELRARAAMAGGGAVGAREARARPFIGGQGERRRGLGGLGAAAERGRHAGAAVRSALTAEGGEQRRGGAASRAGVRCGAGWAVACGEREGKRRWHATLKVGRGQRLGQRQ